MNKDAILATIIGFGVGLIIAGFIFLGPVLIKDLPRISLPNLTFLTAWFSGKGKVKPTPTIKPVSHKLTIESPLPEAIESRNETLVSGNSPPNAIVVLEGENGETVVIANSRGAYAGKLSLGEGKNDLRVTSYADKEVQTQALTVYYTPENF